MRYNGSNFTDRTNIREFQLNWTLSRTKERVGIKFSKSLANMLRDHTLRETIFCKNIRYLLQFIIKFASWANHEGTVDQSFDQTDFSPGSGKKIQLIYRPVNVGFLYIVVLHQLSVLSSRTSKKYRESFLFLHSELECRVETIEIQEKSFCREILKWQKCHPHKANNETRVKSKDSWKPRKILTQRTVHSHIPNSSSIFWRL